MEFNHKASNAPPSYSDLDLNPTRTTHYMTPWDSRAPTDSIHFMNPTMAQPAQHPQAQIFIPNILGSDPTIATCPSCSNRALTTVSYESNTKTHLLALLLCIMGCICCCCLPYCFKSCQTVVHKCSRCAAYIGSYTN